MNPGFQNLPFAVSTVDGRNFIVRQPVVYVTKAGTIYRIPVGATTDGASTPRGTWNLYPPFGPYWNAAVLHDAAYQNTLEKGTPGATGEESGPDTFSWAKANLEKPDCDALLLEACELTQVDWLQRKIIFDAVKDFGETAYENDRKRAAAK